MKISKIIFISLLGGIALIIFAGAIDIRLNGHRGSHKMDKLMKKVKIDHSFKVLNINTSNVLLNKSDSSFIEFFCNKDSLGQLIDYHLENDTLTINNLDKKISLCKLNLSSKPETFLLKNSNLTMNGIFTGKDNRSVLFDLDNSRLILIQSFKNPTSLSFLDVRERNKSSIDGGGLKLDSLKVDLQNSRADLHIKVNKVKGWVSEKGHLHLDRANDIVLKKDSASSIQIY
jgi:hypothetical protein